MKRRGAADEDRSWTETAVREQAVRLLSHRARSSAELRERLTRRGAPAALVDKVIDALERAGLLDDEAFAAAWVEARRGSSPRGNRLLRMELRQKGLGTELVERALDEPVDEHALARQAGEKKARSLGHEPPAVLARKLRAFLLRRGFGEQEVAEVVKSMLSEQIEDA
ncbi:MAG: regulatory protein RecX [Chloroflexota bacterium]|nr:regulatory protein RecX [Chloroflexota bacterium]